MTEKRWDLLCLIGLVAITWMAFAQTLNCGFVDLDDAAFFVNNPHVCAGLTAKGIAWAFTNMHLMHWFPLTYISHMIVCELSGLNPWAHHLGNLLLHICNVILLFSVLKKMTGTRWRSTFVAALFAVHPLNVESVAWISERSNVLSTFFWILTWSAYMDYVQKPISSRYRTVLLWYVLGFLSKPLLVTLPVVLLLLDCWPLNRLKEGWKLIWEKLPLFVLATAGALMTIVAQSNIGAFRSLEQFPMSIRVSNAIWSYGTYLAKAFWPMQLAVFYPHPGNSLPMALVCTEAILLLVVTGLFLLLARQYPYLTIGWFWFGITLMPMIGLMQVGNHAMADRHTYVPMIGVFIALVWGLSDAMATMKKSRFALFTQITLGIGIFMALIGMTRVQVGYWKNSITLFAHAIDVTKNNWVAHNNLGNVLLERGDRAGAISQYKQAIDAWPDGAWVHNNLGYALANEGKFQEAVIQLKQSLRFQPGEKK